MSWTLWSVAGWVLFSLPFGLFAGRAMARVNSPADAEALEWSSLRAELAGIVKGIAPASTNTAVPVADTANVTAARRVA